MALPSSSRMTTAVRTQPLAGWRSADHPEAQQAESSVESDVGGSVARTGVFGRRAAGCQCGRLTDEQSGAQQDAGHKAAHVRKVVDLRRPIAPVSNCVLADGWSATKTVR